MKLYRLHAPMQLTALDPKFKRKDSSSYLGFKSESAPKLTFQSSVVTSLLFSFNLPRTCFITNTFEGPFCEPDLLLPSPIVQMRAVESPDL